MERKILAAIASISARSGYGHMGTAEAGAVLAMLRPLDQSRFIKEVKALEAAGLIHIDEESGHLSLTEAGSSKVAADDLPPPEPVRYEVKAKTAPVPAAPGARPSKDEPTPNAGPRLPLFDQGTSDLIPVYGTTPAPEPVATKPKTAKVKKKAPAKTKAAAKPKAKRK